MNNMEDFTKILKKGKAQSKSPEKSKEIDAYK